MKTMDEKNSQLEILLKKIDELKTEHAKEDVFNALKKDNIKIYFLLK